ncbi:esterase-like activity of phytase family protein [Labrenzia sp. OB1]|uniref:esterase-like activity of phytase family protein n=1 Tax=Labrenzia sp. OB1 TaxID=1561204 RepID=UPI0007B1C1E9|nr:esterase-like activity of phytase family protein [Labrenzia sp. OB1]KZM50968.1 signal peptide protein [Labrenzia sp. OB1]
MTGRRFRHFLKPATALAVFATVLAAPAAGFADEPLSQGKPVNVRTKAIDIFQIGREERTFGKLTFLGGLELLASDREIGGLSGLISLDGGSAFLAVTDHGHWVSGRIAQTAEGTPLDVSGVRMAPLLGADGKTLKARWGHDTEALALDGSDLYVTAETKNAIYRYPWPLATGKERMLGEVKLVEDIRMLPRNTGLEALAIAPHGSSVAGSLIAVAETSTNDGNVLDGYIIGQKGTDRFSIRRHDGFDATDAAYLPDGDLLLVERRFTLLDLIGLRLRRFPGESIRPDALLEGELLLEADFGYQIDNMEALAVHRNEAGETILTLLSDDNRSFLQRTILLRFRLED